MSKIDDGGPAFPQVAPPMGIVRRHVNAYGPALPGERYPISEPASVELIGSGMSLRDWFAGQALLATAGYLESSSIENIAENSYRIADAMLAARKKEQAS